MSHPQPPFGPQDPHQPDREPPTQAYPTAPIPQQIPADPTAPVPQQFPADPTAPQPPVSGAPYPPVSGAPQPPVSGGSYPPATGEPYPPASTAQFPPVPGAPYPFGQPGAAYPPVSGAPYPPGAGYPPPPGGPYPPGAGMPVGPGYPAGPGYPVGPPPPVKGNSTKKILIIIVGVVVAVLALLCCGGGIVALVAGANKAEEVARSLPTPAVTAGVPDDSTSPSSTPTSAKPDGETFDMKTGDTLVLTDDDGTIEITVTKFRTSTKGCKSYAPAPDEGMYLIADVTAEVTTGKGSVNPFFFNWVADDGTKTNGIGGAFSGCGNLLPSGNGMGVGSKRSGTVVFDVPDKNGTLQYEHQFETAGSWKP
ncbi:DUF4352 domain-containing protein [Micromonospora sp. ATA32]|nr:DUF4352 domain-containing protein [Micromonospora sp. ATA32]